MDFAKRYISWGEDEDGMSVLYDEDGNKALFFVTAHIAYRGSIYEILVPAEQFETEDECEAAAYKITTLDRNERKDEYLLVEVEETADAVFGEYMRCYDEET